MCVRCLVKALCCTEHAFSAQGLPSCVACRDTYVVQQDLKMMIHTAAATLKPTVGMRNILDRSIFNYSAVTPIFLHVARFRHILVFRSHAHLAQLTNRNPSPSSPAPFSGNQIHRVLCKRYSGELFMLLPLMPHNWPSSFALTNGFRSIEAPAL